MSKKYKINGLDCPNCAKKLEQKLNELESVTWAKINFVKSYIEIEAENDEKALYDATKLAKQMEPDAVIVANNTGKKRTGKAVLLDISTLAVGLMLAVLTFVLKLPTWLYWSMFVLSAILMGYKTYIKAFNLILKGVINENLLVTISVIGATAVGEHFDGLMVIALYSIGKILESLALDKSKKSIEALSNIKPEFAVLLDENGQEKLVTPSEIKVGDFIRVKAGEKIAVDGIVAEGSVSLNTQSLTGESLPQLVKKGSEVYSGSIVIDGTIVVECKKIFKEGTVSKILDLVENASEKKAKTETVISRISKWYTLGVMVLAVAVWGIVWATTKNINTAIYRGLIFLVVSCPCAFAISVPLAYFSGLGNSSRNGILIKGSNYLDVLAKMNVVAFDKTGTLTTGEFEITEIVPKQDGYSEDDVLYYATLGEAHSAHPLAKAITEKCTQKLENVENVKEIAGKGVTYTLSGEEYFVGRKNKELKNTVVEVYKGADLLGEIYLTDKVKPSARKTIDGLKQAGIKTIMLSGDNEEVVKNVADELNIDYAKWKLLPSEKYEWIEGQKKDGKMVAYVGDGINDAPSLTLSDVGISMGLSGSPASIEVSDIVVANDNPLKIVQAIEISKYTRKIVWENILVSAVIKLTFLSLGAFGVTGMLSAVIADVGVTVLAILNSLRALYFKPKTGKTKEKCKKE